MTNLKNQISRTIPQDAKMRQFTGGEPILYAFGCALLENYLGDYFLYTIVNLQTNKSVKLGRRKTPIAPKEIEKTVVRIRDSGIAGAARFEANRPYGKSILLKNCREILNETFKSILPEYGYTVRKEQISLAHTVLETIQERKTILAEAEVGTGKTLAYLVPAIIAKRGRLNDFWNRSFYPDMSYKDMANMPIVIATSSIALQTALVTDYIPELSRIMLEGGIIKEPLTAVLRKGREHYICDRNLESHYGHEHDSGMKKILAGLLKPLASIDLAETDGLTPHAKRQISVPPRCDAYCSHRSSCRYLDYVNKAMDPKTDIQVVNHNFLIADAMRRADGKQPMIPNYQAIIVDEAHKLLPSARTMYGAELSSDAAQLMLEYIDELDYNAKSAGTAIRKAAKKLYDESRRLFRGFAENILEYNTEDDAERLPAEIGKVAARHLRNMRDITDDLYMQLSSEPATQRNEYRKSQLLWEVNKIRESTAVLASHKGLVLWLERTADDGLTLHAIPKGLDSKLYSDFWSKGIPAVLTSGTLSAGGDFSHIMRTLGLERLGNRITETSKPSPFNHRENALMYISEGIPFPDNNDQGYIEAITDEVERLIIAANGHTAVLFTSYNVMGRVHAALSAKGLPYPLMRLERGSLSAIEKFKQSNNGILFASGALWEGIDIPGDTLSMLIIVKLPFAVPDPISQYEQTLYKNMSEYKDRVVVPEMLIKLKQGFGRLIRTITDSGVVAILDSRINSGGAYRKRVLDALPCCHVTAKIADVVRFYRDKKSPEYFT